MPKLRKLSFRSSVVSVVAAFALESGCGEDDAEPLTCEAPRAVGEACSGEGFCVMTCGERGLQGRIECKDGRVTGGFGSCNPPFPWWLDSGPDASLDARVEDSRVEDSRVEDSRVEDSRVEDSRVDDAVRDAN